MAGEKKLKGRDDRNEPGTFAKISMAASGLVILALVAYIGYQAVTTPAGAEPEVHILTAEPRPDGSFRVEVGITNHAEGGLRQITIELACDDPPVETTVQNVPARGERRVVLFCPEDPGDTEPQIASYARP